MSNDVIDALEQVERILEMCDDPELPEAAADFAMSIEEKVRSIGEWIEEHEEVTDRQLDALENMESGLQRWFR